MSELRIPKDGWENWAKEFNCTKDEFIDYGRRVTGAELYLFYKYKDSLAKDKDQGNRDFNAPSIPTLLATIEDQFSVISQSTDTILKSEPTRKIMWAHAVYLLHVDLEMGEGRPTIPSDKWIGDSEVNRLCFGLLKFFNKERLGRKLDPSRKNQDQKNIAPSNSRALSLNSNNGDSLPTLILATLITLEEADPRAIEIPVEDQTLELLKRRVLEHHGFNPSEHTMTFDEILEDDEVEEVKSEEQWREILARPARMRADGIRVIDIDCSHAVILGTQPNANETPTGASKNQPDPSEEIANKPMKQTAKLYELYQRVYVREGEETVKLLGMACKRRVTVVKTKPMALPSGQDVNREGLSIGADENDAAPVSVDFTKIQELLACERPEWSNVDRCLEELSKALKIPLSDENSILYRLPAQRKQDPKTKRPAIGQRHLPHQIIFMWWALVSDKKHDGGCCCDGCGLGKTHEYVSLILVTHLFWSNHGQPGDRLRPTRPILLVVPHTIVEKTISEVTNMLPPEWKVFRFGDKQKKNMSVNFELKSSVFHQKPDPSKVVVVISFDQLQREDVTPQFQGMFERIIIDEAQGIRRFDDQKQKRGQVLRAFDARYRYAFTGTLVYDNLADIRGILAFLERPWWGSPFDRNSTVNGTDDGPPNVKYLAFKANLPTDPEDGDGEDEPVSLHTNEVDEEDVDDDWYEDCASVDGLDDDDIGDKTRSDWLCSHFPACLFFNRSRAKSISDKKRGKNFKEDGSPFAANPFNEYHAKNKNALRCCTTLAFDYYIKPHIKNNSSEASETIFSRRIQIVLNTLVLARNGQSTIHWNDGRSAKVGDDLPACTIQTHELAYEPDEMAMYEKCFLQCSDKFAYVTKEGLKEMEKDPKGAHKGNQKFASLCTLSTHLGLHGLRRTTTAKFRAQRDESLPLLLDRMKKGGCLNPDDKHKVIDSDEELVRQFLWGSPKLRYLLKLLLKILFTDYRPETHRKVLDFLGIPVILLDTGMSPAERYKVSLQFQNEANPRVLLCTYPLDIAGFDWQNRCATVILVEPAFSLATETQAFSRVFRINQEEPVEVIRLFVEGTYQEIQEACLLRKAAPMFAALGALTKAREDAQVNNPDITAAELAKLTFGIARDRVLKQEEVRDAKEEAARKAGREKYAG